MSNFIYYEHIEDYEEQVRKAKLCDEKDKEIDKLKKENNDLRLLYQRTYKHLFEKGNDELARYFQAQIDECPSFYVEPIIDYFQETKRLNNIIKDIKSQLDYLETYSSKEDVFEDMKRRLDRIENIVNRRR